MKTFATLNLFEGLTIALCVFTLAGCASSEISKTSDISETPKVDPNITAQRLISITESLGPIETFLFCHPHHAKKTKAIPLTHKQIGSNITPAITNNDVFYIPEKTNRKVETVQMCQTPPLKIIPPNYEWVDGLIEGEMISLEYMPPEYGSVKVRTVFERGPVNYSPDKMTHLSCYQIIELDIPRPVVLAPGQTREKSIPLPQKDGKTLQMTSPMRAELGKAEDGCRESSWEYIFERRSENDEVIQYLQNPPSDGV